MILGIPGLTVSQFVLCGPYTETTLLRSYGIVIEYLNRVGLAARDPFDCPMAGQYRRV
jgi:hypothetical protein